MSGDTLAAAHCPRCLADYRAGFEVCADCGTRLEPGPAPAEDEERGEVELIHAPAPAEPPAVEASGAWDIANAQVWGSDPSEVPGSGDPLDVSFTSDLDLDVDVDDVDVDETGYALVMVAPVLTAHEGAERLADAGVDARVVVFEPGDPGSSPSDQAEVRVPWDRLGEARAILGLVV